MPEAAVDEDCYFPLWQHQVRTAREASLVQPEAEPASVELSAERHLRLRVPAADACHHSRTGRRVNDVGHAETAPSIVPEGLFRWPGPREHDHLYMRQQDRNDESVPKDAAMDKYFWLVLDAMDNLGDRQFAASGG
jgi:hypothetical protein